jgi:hypothetical protein
MLSNIVFERNVSDENITPVSVLSVDQNYAFILLWIFMLTADPASDSNRELVKDVRPACRSADYEFNIQRTVNRDIFL